MSVPNASMLTMLALACTRAGAPEPVRVPPPPKARIISVDDPAFQIKATAHAQIEEIEGECVVVGRVKLNDRHLKEGTKRAKAQS